MGNYYVFDEEFGDPDKLNNNFLVNRGIFGSFEQETLAVTTTSASVSYSAEKDTHLIKNGGSQTCYVSFDATATTSDWELAPNEILPVDTNATAIHAITASGTTTLYIIGQD